MRKKIIPLILGILFIFLIARAVTAAPGAFSFLFQLLFNRGVALKQNGQSQINVLLLGIGGGNHDGPNLTDTIILANIDQKKDKVTLISIPRDMWFPDIDQKINAAYAIGQAKKPGLGLLMAEAAVGKITGQEIDYGVRIDFSGFVKAVNLVGGLDINVDNTFDDYQYPIDGMENASCGHTQAEIQAMSNDSQDQLVKDFPCRYKHLHFNKGPQHMDGETALEFVRSRHATGVEGSDFARSKRQEKVIKAFKDKILSPQTLLNPSKIISLYDTLKSSIDTDISQNEYDDFIRLAEEMKNAKIQSAVIDTGDPATNRNGLLNESSVLSDYGYTSALLPVLGNGNYSQIQKYISCEISTGNCSVPPAK